METTTSSTAQTEGLSHIGVVDLRDALHLEVVVAGAEGAHFVLLPMTRLERHGGGDGASHAAMFLDAIKIGVCPVAAFDGPPCAAFQHGVELAIAQVNPTTAADACRHTPGQLVGELDA